MLFRCGPDSVENFPTLTMERYSGWRRTTAIFFYILSIIAFLVSLERVVFDVFGQMWGTMLLNGMSTISLVVGLLAVCAAEKVAIALYAGWSVVTIGLNVIIMFIYNDVGLLSQKEHYLGLLIGNDNWWKTHGIGCSPIATAGSGAGSGAGTQWEAEPGDTCLVSYSVIETVHASIFTFLTLITFVLSLLLLCSHEKKCRDYGEDDDDFSYLSIGQWYGQSRRHDNRSRRTSSTSRSKLV